MSNWYPNTFTIGTGIRVTTITVTTTATALDDLLSTAVAGRKSLPGRRSLIFRNLDSAAAFYILESTTQTATDGWNVEAAEDIPIEGSETATANEVTIADGGAGFYLATASGTVDVKVLEGK
tara:strand:+ start:5449 stop:5814 length:366 start_codon:yes stop_codon:yes gene_type:complete